MIEVICKLIGCAIVSAILITIPILTTCAFAYNWEEGVQAGLTVLCLLEFCGLFAKIADMCDGY